ncbi:MAG TPA: phosphoesterase PA-phosphatase, partial [Segetibacter sp.]
MKKTIVAVFVIAVVYSCKKPDYAKVTHDPLLYCKTVKKLNDIVLENNFPPMIAARNYAYANIAAYEVIAAGDKDYTSLKHQVRDLTTLPVPKANEKIDYPFASLLAFCKVGNAVTFPEGSMDVYVAELKEKIKDAGMPSEVFEGSVRFANEVADTILSWSKKDSYAK